MKKRREASAIIAGALALAFWLIVPVPAGAAQPIATGETNWDGVTVKVMSVIRKGRVLTVKFAAVNEGTATQTVWFGFSGEAHSCYLVDEESGTKYYVLQDKEGHALASANDFVDLGVVGLKRPVAPGKTLRVWMKFPAPPPEVKKISLFLNETEPIEDVPITDK